MQVISLWSVMEHKFAQFVQIRYSQVPRKTFTSMIKKISPIFPRSWLNLPCIYSFLHVFTQGKWNQD
ncbi:hypothetical protein BRADI_4g11289v3 [Brachypodium distachyon]|uniref:Uncharacterized protein n=1 Tax=Brachypodium distachyon TaxID=15368 RepID=A0A0Q3EMB9_BRADI|nr:hypothetical protein BRADI_4g11289v3 [Brachypodium distachyon]